MAPAKPNNTEKDNAVLEVLSEILPRLRCTGEGGPHEVVHRPGIVTESNKQAKSHCSVQLDVDSPSA